MVDPAKRSYLPAWLLESQAQLASFELEHEKTRASIADLRQNMAHFDVLVEASIGPAKPKPDTMQADAAEAAKAARDVGPHGLPGDVGACVCAFCDGPALVDYSICSRAAREWLLDGALWRASYEQQHLDEAWWLHAPRRSPAAGGAGDDGDDTQLAHYRTVALRSALLARDVYAFVDDMCRAISAPRRSDPAPWTYSRRDREVAHPLPGSGARGGDMVARTYTLSTEGRRNALRALEAMVVITAHAKGAEDVARRVQEAGAVAMLVALLANELGAIQELAAAALANLACPAGVHGRVLAEMAACGARKSLVALLTSPSARVTLHVSSAPGAPQQRTHDYCAGMGCKHASRALVNTFLSSEDHAGIALPPDFRRDATAAGNAAREAERRQPWPRVLEQWDFYSFYSSGSFKDYSKISLSIDKGGAMGGFGADNIGAFRVRGTVVGSQLYFSKTYGAEDARRSGHVAHALWAAPDAMADGFWGVWEVTCTDTHFELRRGGCCRLLRPRREADDGAAQAQQPAGTATVAVPEPQPAGTAAVAVPEPAAPPAGNATVEPAPPPAGSNNGVRLPPIRRTL